MLSNVNKTLNVVFLIYENKNTFIYIFKPFDKFFKTNMYPVIVKR